MVWIAVFSIVVLCFLAWATGGPPAALFAHKAKQHENRYDYASAIAQYEAALRATPSFFRFARTRYLIQLALASYNSGRMDDCLAYSERAFTVPPPKELLPMAHSTAGLALADMGRFPEAERHREQAASLAEKLGNVPQAAQHLASLASVQMMQGKLSEAVATARWAASKGSDAAKIALVMESECHRAWGQWDAAREAIRQAQATAPYKVAKMQQRSEATMQLGMAWVELDAENPGAGLELLEKADHELRTDERLHLWCEASRARALAMLGRRDEAEAAIRDVEAAIAARPSDRASRALGMAMLGYAADALGQHERARSFWEQYIAHTVAPVYFPGAYFHLGESNLHLGDSTKALEWYRKSLECGIDTYKSRLARGRIQQLTGA